MEDARAAVASPLTVAILHGSAVARGQIAHVFRGLGHLVIGEAATPSDMPLAAVNVVVVDSRIPELVPTVVAIRAAQAGAKILVLASLDEIGLVRSTVAVGADGAIRRPPLASRVIEALGAGDAPPA